MKGQLGGDPRTPSRVLWALVCTASMLLQASRAATLQNAQADGRSAAAPRILLRSGHIDTSSQPTRRQALEQRRGRMAMQEGPLVAHAAVPHSHPDWGVMHGMEQLLVSLTPGGGAEQHEEVQRALEAAGGYVSGYLPESTLLVMGDDRVVAAAEALPHVHWVGEYQEGMKLDPEWQLLLDLPQQLLTGPGGPRGSVLSAAITAGGRSLPPGLSPPQARLVASVAREAAAAADKENALALAAAMSPMSPVSPDEDAASPSADGRRFAGAAALPPPAPAAGSRLGVVVTFPSAYEALPRRPQASSSSSSSSATAAPSSWTAPAASSAAATAPGGNNGDNSGGVHLASPAHAAAADWPAALDSLFGPGQVSVTPEGKRHATVRVPADLLGDVLAWLAAQPTVHWLAPKHAVGLANFNAAAIIQSAQPGPRDGQWEDAGTHPVWAAGIKGSGQVVGCGDSGVEFRHCFFVDDNFDLSQRSMWQRDGTRSGMLFNSTEHRKIAMYYAAYGDATDSNGHGTHVVGSIVGAPPGGDTFQGMAPDAKVAFWDLSVSSSNMVMPPGDLHELYYPLSYGAGARVHSDSWGSTSIAYDIMSWQVDMFTWENQDFLPMFAAGNDGSLSSRSRGSFSGEYTVTSPGTAKNCITVGATDSTVSSAIPTREEFVTYDMTVRGDVDMGTAGSEMKFKVLEATFGAPLSNLGDSEYALSVADPPEACTPLTNGDAVQGTIVLIIRGSCQFDAKASYAERAGAVGALVYDNQAGAYFKLGSDGSTSVTVPSMAVPRRIGQQLVTATEAGMELYARLAPSRPPENVFDNLASYSSQGPTTDGRIKPDIVAPGTTQSSHIFGGQCGTEYMQGTSMATPIVAGAAALVRQYFQDGYYPSGKADASASHWPSGPLVKAVLLGGAKHLTGFEADTGLPIDPPPSTRQGFGRVYLQASLPLDGSDDGQRLQVVDGATISKGDTHRYCVRASGGGQLAITLAWFDYPSLESADKALVNDLDLAVRAAGFNGTLIMGNGGGALSASGGDRLNTVEQVVMEHVPQGDVSIEVTGYELYGRASPQPYALVVVGAFEGVLGSEYNPNQGDEEARECSVAVVSITSGPEGLTNQDPVSFEFKAASDSKGTVECRLYDSSNSAEGDGVEDGGDDVTHGWKPCTSPAEYPGLRDGKYMFSVRSADGSSIASRGFTLDTSPPEMEWAASPDAQTAAAVAQLDWSAKDQGTVEFKCRLNLEAGAEQQPDVYDGVGNEFPLGNWVESCKPPLRLHWLLPGSYRFEVNASDEAGNALASPSSKEWTVEFEANTPYVRLTSGPFGATGSGGGDFEFVVLEQDGSGGLSEASSEATECVFQSVEAGAKFEDVDVDQAGGDRAWEACNSPVSRSGLEDGSYLFMARKAESRRRSLLAGTLPPDTYAVSLFNVDSTPPEVTITESPPPYSSSSSADFEFKSDDPDAVFMCTLEGSGDTAVNAASSGGNKTKCGSPKSYAGLEDGRYEFLVTASDVVGNEAPPQNVSFMVDTHAPLIESVDYPAATRDDDVTISWTANDVNGSGIVSVQCALSAVALKDGGSSSSEDGDDEDGGYKFEDCESPKEYKGLDEGVWGFRLRLTDRANLTTESSTYSIAVDNTPPVTRVSGGPSEGDSNPSTVEFRMDADDGPYGSNVTTFQCMLTSSSSSTTQKLQSVSLADEDDKDSQGSWHNCSSPKVYRDLSSGSYSFQARAMDAAGNLGEPSASYTFSVDETLPLPESDTGVSDSGSSTMSTFLLVGIIVGSVLLGLSLLGILVDCLKRCCRRRHNAGAAGGMAHPAARRAGTAGSGPGTLDAELQAAIAASLAEQQRRGEGGGGAGLSSAASHPLSSSRSHRLPPPPPPHANGGAAMAPDAASGPVGGGLWSGFYPTVSAQGGGFNPPAAAGALYDPAVHSGTGGNAFMYPAPAPPGVAGEPAPPPAAPSAPPAELADDDDALEAAIQASLAEETQRPRGPAAAVSPSSPTGDDPYRAALQASLEERYRAAVQRQSSLEPPPPPTQLPRAAAAASPSPRGLSSPSPPQQRQQGGGTEEDEDPELVAAIQASLREAAARGPPARGFYPDIL